MQSASSLVIAQIGVKSNFLMGTATAAAFMRGDEEDSMRDDAAFLLDFYDTFKDFVASDVTDIALSSLAKIEGRFGEPHAHNLIP